MDENGADWGTILKLLKYWDGSLNIHGCIAGDQGCDGFFCPMKYNWSTTFSSLYPWTNDFSPGKEGHELVA